MCESQYKDFSFVVELYEHALNQHQFAPLLHGIPTNDQDDILQEAFQKVLELTVWCDRNNEQAIIESFQALSIYWIKIKIRQFWAKQNRSQNLQKKLAAQLIQKSSGNSIHLEQNQDVLLILAWKLTKQEDEDPNCILLNAQLRMNLALALTDQESDYVFFRLFNDDQCDKHFNSFAQLTEWMRQNGHPTSDSCKPCKVLGQAHEKNKRGLTSGRISQIKRAAFDKYMQILSIGDKP